MRSPHFKTDAAIPILLRLFDLDEHSRHNFLSWESRMNFVDHMMARESSRAAFEQERNHFTDERLAAY